MNGSTVFWVRKPTTAASTMEADCLACGASAQEGLSLLKPMQDSSALSIECPLVALVAIPCDDKSALALRNVRKDGQRAQHISAIHHFARDHVDLGELSFVYCRMNVMHVIS
jgi:hypothetical protein